MQYYLVSKWVALVERRVPERLFVSSYEEIDFSVEKGVLITDPNKFWMEVTSFICDTREKGIDVFTVRAHLFSVVVEVLSSFTTTKEHD